MDDKRRAEIEERLAAVPDASLTADAHAYDEVWAGSKWVAECLTGAYAQLFANAPADIRDLLDDNAALAQELARALEEEG